LSDFNDDGKADVFTTWGGKWRVSWGGKSDWEIINTSSVGVADIRLGDFNDDGKADVFTTWGGKWRVSWGGKSDWEVINTSSVGVADLNVGNFDGDKSDGIVRSCLWISRFTTEGLNNADADAILAKASSAIQTSDTFDDVACPLTLTRARPVTIFRTGDGSIDSRVEFVAVVGLPGHVKVVNQINWCGAILPNIVGCSPTPGDSQVVVRLFNYDMEGLLWLHEYGHTRGLSHRNDSTAVMNPTLDITGTGTTAKECTSFLK
jgi:hypothetical protein